MWIFDLINIACAVILVIVMGYAVAWLGKGLIDAFRDMWRRK